MTDGSPATHSDDGSAETPYAPSSTELQGIARFRIDVDRIDEFKRLSARCMQIVREQDTGTLQYEIYFDDDETECIVLERYRDSAALIEHLAHIGDLMEAIVATGTVTGELLGDPGPELRANLESSPVRLFTRFARLE